MHQSYFFCLIKQSAAAQAALQAAQALAGQTETQGGPNTVLRVIVEHMVYPVTLDVLFQVTTAICLVVLAAPVPVPLLKSIQAIFILILWQWNEFDPRDPISFFLLRWSTCGSTHLAMSFLFLSHLPFVDAGAS